MTVEDRKYICAFTTLGCDYPEYMNVYLHGDEVEVQVRGNKKADGSCGDVVAVRFPKVLFELMLEEAVKNMKG